MSFLLSVGSASQIVCGIFIAVVYIKLYGYYGPFVNDDDDILQEMAQFQVFITLFISLLIRLGMYSTACCHSLLNRSVRQILISNPQCNPAHRHLAEALKGVRWSRALDVALVVANLLTSGVFMHSLLTARNYYVFRRDAAASQKSEDQDTEGKTWGVEGDGAKLDQQSNNWTTVPSSTV